MIALSPKQMSTTHTYMYKFSGCLQTFDSTCNMLHNSFNCRGSGRFCLEAEGVCAASARIFPWLIFAAISNTWCMSHRSRAGKCLVAPLSIVKQHEISTSALQGPLRSPGGPGEPPGVENTLSSHAGVVKQPHTFVMHTHNQNDCIVCVINLPGHSNSNFSYLGRALAAKKHVFYCLGPNPVGGKHIYASRFLRIFKNL